MINKLFIILTLIALNTNTIPIELVSTDDFIIGPVDHTILHSKTLDLMLADEDSEDAIEVPLPHSSFAIESILDYYMNSHTRRMNRRRWPNQNIFAPKDFEGLSPQQALDVASCGLYLQSNSVLSTAVEALLDNPQSARALRDAALSGPLLHQELSTFFHTDTSINHRQLKQYSPKPIKLTEATNIQEIAPDSSFFLAGHKPYNGNSWDYTLQMYNKKGTMIGQPIPNVSEIDMAANSKYFWTKGSNDNAQMHRKNGTTIGQALPDVQRIFIAPSSLYSCLQSRDYVAETESVQLYGAQGELIGDPILKVKSSIGNEVRIAPDSQHICVRHDDRTAQMYTNTGTAVGQRIENVRHVQFSPNSAYLWIQRRDDSAQIYTEQGAVGQRINHVRSIQMAPDSSHAFLHYTHPSASGNYPPSSVQAYDADGKTLGDVIDNVGNVHIAPNSKCTWIVQNNGHAQIYDKNGTAVGSPIENVSSGYGMLQPTVNWAPNSTYAWLVKNNGHAQIYDKNGVAVGSPIENRVNNIAIAPNSKYAWLRADTGITQMYDSNGAPMKRPITHSSFCNGIHITPDSSQAWITDNSNRETHSIYDQTGTLISTVGDKGERSDAGWLHIAPDSSYALTHNQSGVFLHNDTTINPTIEKTLQRQWENRKRKRD